MDKLQALRALPWDMVEAAAKAGGASLATIANLKDVHAGVHNEVVGLNLGITFNLKKFDHKPDGKYLAEIITGSDVDGGFDSTRTVVNSDTAEQEVTMLKVLALVNGSVAGRSFKVGDTIEIPDDTARSWFHRAFVKPVDETGVSYFERFARESPDEYTGAIDRIKAREVEIADKAMADAEADAAAKAAAETAPATEPHPIEAELANAASLIAPPAPDNG